MSPRTGIKLTSPLPRLLPTLSGESYYIIRQEPFIILSGKIITLSGSKLITFLAFLLHRQAVITLTGDGTIW